jgi:hypothetical protein
LKLDYQWTRGIKDSLIVVAIESAATEATAGRKTTGGIGQLLR